MKRKLIVALIATLSINLVSDNIVSYAGSATSEMAVVVEGELYAHEVEIIVDWLESGVNTPQEIAEVNGIKYFHLILLAENNTGYKNLVQLVSKANIEGFYYKPRVDKELLRQHHEGIICLSACIAGEVPYYIHHDEMEKAEASVKEHLEIFGRENYFLEIQNHGIPEEKKANKGLVELAEKYGIGLVATNDAHYLKKEDSDYHDVLLCIQMGRLVTDTDRMKFPSDDYYVKSPEEMAELFADLSF